ncbi:MAG TPA: L,D-transpeptidase [Terrimicrobiaceae bacterium]|nr:L,D-transpeptidase [Terrimicrobiaceae bacterium]
MSNSSSSDVHVPLRLRIDARRQVLEVLRGDQITKSYPISTSKFGLGFESESGKTPLGRFVVSEKIGSGAPAGAVFKSRLPTGQIAPQGGQEDLVLTRILWLAGLEEANANTKERYIYIHGTNQEALLGTPASHGCVRMSNADVVECFDGIPEGTVVEIVT